MVFLRAFWRDAETSWKGSGWAMLAGRLRRMDARRRGARYRKSGAALL